MVWVTAGILLECERVLIAQRLHDDELGLRWEFPGGKVEVGESPEECLKREFFEEFGVTVEIGEFLMKSEFDYGDNKIELLAYWIEEYSGGFKLNSHESIQWVTIKDLDKYNFLEADKPIVQKLMSDIDVLRSRSKTGSGN